MLAMWYILALALVFGLKNEACAVFPPGLNELAGAKITRRYKVKKNIYFGKYFVTRITVIEYDYELDHECANFAKVTRRVYQVKSLLGESRRDCGMREIGKVKVNMVEISLNKWTVEFMSQLSDHEKRIFGAEGVLKLSTLLFKHNQTIEGRTVDWRPSMRREILSCE